MGKEEQYGSKPKREKVTGRSEKGPLDLNLSVTVHDNFVYCIIFFM